MARRVITNTEYIDDIGGGSAERTVSFAFDSTAYEIDLSKKNATAFEKAMRPYVDAARKAPRAVRKSGGKSAASSRDLPAIRAWAADNGFEVSERGRIEAAVLEAYDAR